MVQIGCSYVRLAMFEFKFPVVPLQGLLYMHGREAERQAGEGGGEPGGIVCILLVRGLTNIHMVVHGGRERVHLV